MFYNRMDNILARETKEYADFTKEQAREIDLLADQFHQWHRSVHLPQYADLLRDINGFLESDDDAISYELVQAWSTQIEQFVREMADCYPLNSAFDLMRTLSDAQVDQVLEHGIKEYDEFIEERIDRSLDDRIAKRYKETVKWLGRVELNLNREQKEKLRETIVSEQRLGGAGMELWKSWHEEFVALLRDRNDEEFESKAGQHIRKLWTLQDDNFPDTVEHNRTLWIDYFYGLSQSQTESQRKDFSNWLAKMASNLDSIAANVRSNKLEPMAVDGGACANPTYDDPGNSENTTN